MILQPHDFPAALLHWGLGLPDPIWLGMEDSWPGVQDHHSAWVQGVRRGNSARVGKGTQPGSICPGQEEFGGGAGSVKEVAEDPGFRV